jgi:hypothetical protein
MILEILFMGFVACAVFFALCALRTLILKHFIREMMADDEERGEIPMD